MTAIELFSSAYFSDANLKAYWRFNQNDLTDSIASITATSGGAGCTSDAGGKFGYGRKFDGATTMTIAHSTPTDMTNMKTVIFWATIQEVSILTSTGIIMLGHTMVT